MALNVGSRIAHYDVTALIGEGGMGQVYQATDTKLNRQVALKILPEAFASDPDRLARFQREAQVLASLNHPNIAAIYGLEEDDDTRALVLELVEGPTLADRIAQGPVPLDEALPIAKQIAEALEAAHEAGVIHRDLKPANIKVRDDGTVKVLDFGLAKALDTTPEGDPSLSPTLTAAATQMGVIMGTAAYMSPEQARGKPVDKRADIWAFGAVLFEMLTGAKPFPGDDISQTLARVIERDPDWDALPKTLAPALDTYLRRCLQRDPRERVRDIGDVRLAMEGAFETAVAMPAVVSGSRNGTRAWFVGSATAILTGIVAIAIAWMIRPPPPQPVVDHVSVTIPSEVTLDTTGFPFALSPDGRQLVYAAENGGVTQLYHRSMDQRSAVPLANTDGARVPFFSHDSRSVGYWAGNTIWKLSLMGGFPQRICELPDGAFPVAAWGPDDQIWFGGFGDGLHRVPAAGGIPEVVTTLAEGETGHGRPQLLPNGRGVIFSLFDAFESKVAVYSPESATHRILADGYAAQFVASGHLMVGTSWPRPGLSALPFDADALEPVGAPVRVLDAVSVNSGGVPLFSVGQDGSLLYVPGEAGGRRLVWVDRDGVEDFVDDSVRRYRNPRVSPDGDRVVVEVGDNAEGGLWVLDLERDRPMQLTFDRGREGYPLWHPEGDRIVFASALGGRLMTVAADGSGQTEPLVRHRGFAYSWSTLGQELATVTLGPGGAVDVGLVSLSGAPAWRPLLNESYLEADPAISPDGRWMAFVSGQSGGGEIWVSPFPPVEGGGRWPISRGGGEDPTWSADGSELFYRSRSPQAIMAVSVTTEPSFSADEPVPLFDDVYFSDVLNRDYDLAPDGRFLMLKEDVSAQGRQINIIRNFDEELKRLVPTE